MKPILSKVVFYSLVLILVSFYAYSQNPDRLVVVKPKEINDVVFDDAVFVPSDLPAGTYAVQIALVDRLKHKPRVNLAIEGKTDNGWYPLGQIRVIRRTEDD